MLNRHIVQTLTFLVLLALPLFCFADYKVVVKKNGKIIEGKLVAEDNASVTIISQGTRLRYKKETLDLERMKELNAGYYTPSDVRTLDIPVPSEQQAQSETSLADVAKQSRDAKTTTTPAVASDANERTLGKFISDLEEQVRVRATAESQINLSKAKKALQTYRNRDSRELTNAERRQMLEQLAEALNFEYDKEVEAGASDEKTAALKKRIEDTKAQLSRLD